VQAVRPEPRHALNDSYKQPVGNRLIVAKHAALDRINQAPDIFLASSVREFR